MISPLCLLCSSASVAPACSDTPLIPVFMPGTEQYSVSMSASARSRPVTSLPVSWLDMLLPKLNLAARAYSSVASTGSENRKFRISTEPSASIFSYFISNRSDRRHLADASALTLPPSTAPGMGISPAKRFSSASPLDVRTIRGSSDRASSTLAVKDRLTPSPSISNTGMSRLLSDGLPPLKANAPLTASLSNFRGVPTLGSLYSRWHAGMVKSTFASGACPDVRAYGVVALTESTTVISVSRYLSISICFRFSSGSRESTFMIFTGFVLSAHAVSEGCADKSSPAVRYPTMPAMFIV